MSIASDYFVTVATDVFGTFLRELGSRQEIADDPTCVRFSTDLWFLEILFLPSDGPNYSPRVEVGCQQELFADPRRNRVDIMHTAPVGSEERNYNLRWRFRTVDELREALVGVRDRILKVYAVPYLLDVAKLKELVIRRHDEVEAAWSAELDYHNDTVYRSKAEDAFRRGEYVVASEFFERIPINRRSKIDESKLRIAKSRLNEVDAKFEVLH